MFELVGNDFRWFFAALFLALAVMYFHERAAKKRVIEYLERKGCQDVLVQTKLFAGGRGVLSFHVEYMDRKGNVRENSCTVRTGLLSDETIYWKRPLKVCA